MLYVVTLNYARPIEEVNGHLDAHKQWLGRFTKSGHILAAGPLADGTGGVMLAHCAGSDELEAMMEQDAFVIERVVTVSVQSFEPALRAEAFAAQWAPLAKAIAAG